KSAIARSSSGSACPYSRASNSRLASASSGAAAMEAPACAGGSDGACAATGTPARTATAAATSAARSRALLVDEDAVLGIVIDVQPRGIVQGERRSVSNRRLSGRTERGEVPAARREDRDAVAVEHVQVLEDVERQVGRRVQLV